MGASCGVPEVMAKDPRFQALKEGYKNRHFSDDYIAQAIQSYRNTNNKDNDFFPAQSTLTRFMNEKLVKARVEKTYSKLTHDKLYDLYNTLYTLYSPKQLDDRLKLISHAFSSIVNNLEKHNKEPWKTRQDIIEDQAIKGKDGKVLKSGFQVILEKVFSIWEKKYSDVDYLMENWKKIHPEATESEIERQTERARYTVSEMQRLLANKERMAALAAKNIGENEGFKIDISNFEIDFSDPEEEDNLSAEGEEEENLGDDYGERSKGDRYGDFRKLKLMATISPKARRLLASLPMTNSSSSPITDDMGFTTYIEPRHAAVVLKRVLVNSTPESMMADLKDAAVHHPWINGLIEHLEKNPDSKKTVFGAFKSAETTYAYITIENGKYVCKMANSKSQGYAMMRDAGANLASGWVLNEDTSLVTGFGELKSLDELKAIHEKFREELGFLFKDYGAAHIRMVEGDYTPSQEMIQRRKNTAKYNEGSKPEDWAHLEMYQDPKDQMAEFLHMHPEVPERLAEYARGLGFDISAKDIRDAALQTMKEKSYGFIVGTKEAKRHASFQSLGRNKLYQIASFIGGAMSRAEEIRQKGQMPTGEYFYNTASKAFRAINSALALSKYNEVEARVVSGDSSLSTYNNVNLLHQVTDKLGNKTGLSEKQYRDMLERDFLQYEGMAIGEGEHRIITGWLKSLYDNPPVTGESGRNGTEYNPLRVINMAEFNHVDYPKLTRQQKIVASITAFFSDAFGGRHLVEMPIQSDYETAWDFVVVPDAGEGTIADKLTDEVLCELDRMSAIETRLKDENRAKLSVYEEQGLKFNIFPAFNTNGFRQRYTAIENAEDARAFVLSQVQEQLDDIVRKDIDTVEKSGALTNPLMKNIGQLTGVSFYAKDGKFSSLDEASQGAFRYMCESIYYNRQQMTKLFVGGTEQFNGLLDFEKRMMLMHATRTSLDTSATWNGEQVGKKNQRVIYVEDPKTESGFIDDIKEMLSQLRDEKVISESQYKSMLKAYSGIKTTDGQGFRTLESYRTVMIMADMWDNRHETAYKRIMNGNPTKSDISVFMQNIKPVYTGYEHIDAAAGENQKPVKLTVLHKYSEMVLLPVVLAEKCLQMKSVPVKALSGAASRIKGLDLILFHSCVKVGAHSMLNPFAEENGKRKLNTTQEIEDYIVDRTAANKFTIHTLPFEFFGIAASTPAHGPNNEIAWSSQAEKQAQANIQKGDKVIVNGKEMDALKARELHGKIKAAEVIESYRELRKLFNNYDELERVFRTELATKSYTSSELLYALKRLEDGTFALPLFSPNVEHQVQEILASIIKKRLTKKRTKGANILQSTGFGMDLEASIFEETSPFQRLKDKFNEGKDSQTLSANEKLKIVFEGEGAGKRIKYVEVYIPIHDKRLLRFADENGEIRPERLQELVDKGIIPESMLEFIAYRTPSDAEHSVIPCRIKGFISNTSGETIRMPKEVMVMTGHDYDGDKMRCHFKNFRLIDEKNEDVTEQDIARAILGQVDVDDLFKMKCVVDEYDYDKSPLENSSKARENARIELLFAQLTSPSGSRRMLIPGGTDETNVIAKTMYLMRAAKNEETRKTIVDSLTSQYGKREYKAYLEKHPDSDMTLDEFLSTEEMKQKLAEKRAEYTALARKDVTLYKTLVNQSVGDISDIYRTISSTESPYSLGHSVDAFEYIMGGSQMISIYAMYSSSMAMMQRLDLEYVNKLTANGYSYDVEIFGCKFGKLFNVKNHRGRLGMLGFSRLLNAAVDNNKDPLLGHLNQTPEMAEMTFLLFAAGLTEDEVHMIYNQPAVIELIRRLKGRDSEGLAAEVEKLLSDLEVSEYSSNPYNAVKSVRSLTYDELADNLSKSFEDIEPTSGLAEQQGVLLKWLAHLNPAAQNLAEFVKLIRPESESGAIGTSVANIITKVVKLRKFREKLSTTAPDDLRISGMDKVLGERDVHEGWDKNYIYEVLGDELPEVVALNALMIESSLDMFMPMFPQARESWVQLATELAGAYRYKNMQDGVIKKIGNEMILWKLLSSNSFIVGDRKELYEGKKEVDIVNEEQKRVLVDVPKQLKDLKIRIAKAQNVLHKIEEGQPAENFKRDKAAEALIGNAFLEKLRVTSPENSGKNPRIMFTLSGPAIEGQQSLIRASWGELLNSEDKEIRDLGLDLLKYNLFTNGFSYGMYEFSHMAPFSVLFSSPYFIDSLNDIRTSDWNDERDRQNFINQYYMNHWGDKKFLNLYLTKDIVATKDENGLLRLDEDQMKQDLLKSISNEKYILVSDQEYGTEQKLYRVLLTGGGIYLQEATKLGSRNKHGQYTVFYNPKQDYLFIKPIEPGNDSAWGRLDAADPYAETDAALRAIEKGGPDRPAAMDQLVDKIFGGHVDIKKAQASKIEDKTEKESEKNEKNLEDTPQVPEVAQQVQGGMSEEMRKNLQNMFNSAKTMFSLVRVDENEDFAVEKVPGTPQNIREARRQRAYVYLNKYLRDLMRQKGIAVGTIDNSEARMGINGITIFDRPRVLAEGLVEMIQVAEGKAGEEALPEEFAHLALEMLGYTHSLVQRLLRELSNNQAALEEAYEGQYDQYAEAYGNDRNSLVLEAAGKLVAKQMFRQAMIRTSGIRGLVTRVIDAIKNMLRLFTASQIKDAILDADGISSKIARDLLGGKILDDMSLENISATREFYNLQKDITEKNDVVHKLLKIETKRLSIFEKRLGYATKSVTVSESLEATKDMVAKLTKATENLKVEAAVTDYIKDSLNFLQNTENSLQDVIDTGKPANVLAKKLNVVRDTIFSFAAALSAIQDAIASGEIEDTVQLDNMIKDLEHVLNKFYKKYNRIAQLNFEEALANVYGKHGVTVTIGKDKGRNISIHEMATMADRDITIASRWFNSLADCNDYVLKAVDDITRNAKYDARQRLYKVKPKIDAAIAKLFRETGSRDQSFMIAKARYDGGKWCNGKADDGKLHYTGKYITPKEAERLPKPQKDFYDTIMPIMAEALECIPESLYDRDKLNIVCVRKSTMERVRNSVGTGQATTELCEGIKNTVMDTSDNIDYDHQEVAVDFENNRVDKLPVNFIKKGEGEQFDDMTDDVAASVLAFAGMAFEYNELNKVVNILENMKYMSSQRKVGQYTGKRQKRETIETDGIIYHAPFTVSQEKTNIQKAMESFYSMHIYKHMQAEEGTVGNTNISKRKLADMANTISSFSQMALNLPQRISNVTTGLMQVIIESAGGGIYNGEDVAWATAVYMGNSADRFAETGQMNPDNKLSLWAEKFDVHQDNGRGRKNFKKGWLSRVFNTHLLYAGLTIGEDYLSLTTSLAAARNFKVIDDGGHLTNLWDAYKIEYTDPVAKTGAYLELKKGYKRADGTEITAEDEKKFQKLVAGLNFELQGIYNLDDKSAIQQYAFGALIIMYRKWIAPALKRRYARVNYNMLKGEFNEGYQRTLWRNLWEAGKGMKDQVTEGKSAWALLNIFEDIKAFRNSILVNWSKMDEYEKSNIRRACTELGIVAGLWASCALWGKIPPTKDKDDPNYLNWWDRSILAQVYRLRTELGSMAPTPMIVDEALHILRSPFAALRTIQSTINVLYLLMPSSYEDEIKSGRYKGHTKAYKYFREFPIISMFKKVENFIDPTPMLNYYKNDVVI